MKSIGILAIGILVILTNTVVCTIEKVQHGSSYTIRNEADEMFLTATPHRYRPNFGIYPGKSLTSEFIWTPNQVWDLIRIPGSTERYWVLAKAAVLNTVSSLLNTESPMPEKNFLEFIPVNVTLNLSEGDNKKNGNGFATAFLMKSSHLNTCIQSQGQEKEISYAKCNPENRAQRWFLDYYFEDKQIDDGVDLGRNKLKFYCKFHG